MQTESETSIAQNARPLATQPLGRLMRRYAVPCMTSLVVAALYNMVDQVFIANAPDLGSVGNAATTVVFPLTVAALAIAVMLGDGCCAFVSLMLGAGKQEEAHRAVGALGYSRSDFIVTDAGVIFLEINTLPGLTKASLYPKALATQGLDFADFLHGQIALAERRTRG